MKQTFLVVLMVLLFLGLQGCEKKTTENVISETLSSPLGLRSITGDGQVTLLWNTSNYESDFNGYEIYKLDTLYSDIDTLYSDSTAPEEIPSGFTWVTELDKTPPCNTIQSRTVSGLTNGKTYSFLVIATNNKGHISRPSNIVNDTPRPETHVFEDDTMYTYLNKCGYELSDFSVTDMFDIDDYNTPDGQGDFILELLNFPGGVAERLWLAGTNGGEVMDLGYMNDWNEADVAPETGYAPTGYSVYAIQGHVYAIRTGDNHYGKIQILELDVNLVRLILKACYQTKAGERQYKIIP